MVLLMCKCDQATLSEKVLLVHPLLSVSSRLLLLRSVYNETYRNGG